MEDAPTEHASRIARIQGIYAIVGDEDPIGQARAAVDGGAGVVQLRMKKAPSGAVLAAAREIVAMVRGRALVVVNDRADLAVLSGADGVHVGDEDLPAEEARALSPRRAPPSPPAPTTSASARSTGPVRRSSRFRRAGRTRSARWRRRSGRRWWPSAGSPSTPWVK
jgi:hypothetical protein